MLRIGAVGRVGAAQARDGAARAGGAVPAPRALVVLAGGRREEPHAARRPGSARPCAGFVAQLLVAADPALRASRLERTRDAAAHYAETARRLA